MRVGPGLMGCSVTELWELGSPFIPTFSQNTGFYGGTWNWDIFENKGGFERFVHFVKTRGAGYECAGICLFADNSNFGNGEKLAKWLIKHGARVEKTSEYTNYGHGGKCTVWAWYHKEEPKKAEVAEDARLEAIELPKVVAARRSVSSARRTSMVAKAKTAVRRIASKRTRTQ